MLLGYISFLRDKKWALAGIAAGITLLSAGVVRGETTLVLHKAVRICLQCIGVS
jgi:hypothetical protein